MSSTTDESKVDSSSNLYNGKAAADNGAKPTPVKRHTNALLMLAYGTIVGLWFLSQIVHIPYVVHLLLLVSAILYSACHWSLILCEDDDSSDSDDNQSEGQRSRSSNVGEVLSKEDAYSFPIMGSISLFSLYLAFRFLDRDLVNLLIGCYFCLVGCIALTATATPALSSLLSTFIPPSILNKTYTIGKEIKHSLPESVLGESPLQLTYEFHIAEIIALLPSIATTYIYFQTKHWTLNNILGVCFCLQGIERFSLGTYKIGAILLIGLFFYDIFWVFGTDVMVTVAKNLDGPIKILFPRSLVPNAETGKLDLSLLGLGDIVIPGFFLALLLRFDAMNANIPTNIHPIDVHYPFPKPYFHTCLIGYVLGMGLTMFVMIQFNAAQPALLYLVPACLGSSLLTAFIRNETKALFEYSEEEEEEEEGEEKAEKETEETSTEKESKKDQ